MFRKQKDETADVQAFADWIEDWVQEMTQSLIIDAYVAMSES